MANPYQTPTSEVAGQRPLGTFSLDVCFSQSWKALTASFWLVVSSSLVLFVMSMVGAIILVIGWIFVLPALLWGGVRLYLNMLEGRAELADVFSGFQGDYWKNTGRFLIVIVVTSILSTLANGVYYAGMAMDDPYVTWSGYALGILLQFIFLSRFYLCVFYIVDQDMPAMEALSASWQATGRQWPLFLLVVFAAGLIAALGALACLVGLVVTIPFGYMMYASAYRQFTDVSAEPADAPEDYDSEPLEA